MKYIKIGLILGLFVWSYAYSASVDAPTSPTIVQVKTIDPILDKIAYCESHNDPGAKNSLSTASGRFQFLASSWVHYGTMLWGSDFKNHNVFDWNDNTELANFAFQKDGTAPWLSSKFCWNPLTADV